MAVIDDVLATPTYLDVVGEITAAIDAWNALDPGTRPTLAAHLGLTAQEFADWGGPGTHPSGKTSLGDAMALQVVLQARM